MTDVKRCWRPARRVHSSRCWPLPVPQLTRGDVDVDATAEYLERGPTYVWLQAGAPQDEGSLSSSSMT